jgi:NAD(P)H-dependent flavin oxidoreductase YrpB (nitropropane dioxygenase family)
VTIDIDPLSQKLHPELVAILRRPGHYVHAGTASARMASKKILNLWEVFMYSFTIAKELQQPWLKMVLQTLKLGLKQIDSMMRMSQMMKMHTITITTGDLETGMTAAGMSVGLVHDVPTIAELLERLFAEIKDTQSKLNAQIDG